MQKYEGNETDMNCMRICTYYYMNFVRNPFICVLENGVCVSTKNDMHIFNENLTPPVLRIKYNFLFEYPVCL